jgi:hypothetical protein
MANSAKVVIMNSVQIPVSSAQGGLLPGVELNDSTALLDLMEER